MPSAPTPGPPSSECSDAASARVQEAIGDVRPDAIVTNSLETQTLTSDFTISPVDIALPGVPNSDGITTGKPASTTSSANACTDGVMPGISWMTTTPGPVPLRNTGKPRPSASKTLSSQPASLDMIARLGGRRHVRSKGLQNHRVTGAHRALGQHRRVQPAGPRPDLLRHPPEVAVGEPLPVLHARHRVRR